MSAHLELVDRCYRGLVRPLLFRAHGGDAEAAHDQTLALLARVGHSRQLRGITRALVGSRETPVTVAGIGFANRVGLAAGMDKNGRALRAWPALGFGHVEMGTVTAQAQPGNPAPRMFRLPHSGAIINRMGFNNDGAHAVARRLEELDVRSGIGARLGISLGKSKVTPLADAVADYVTSFDLLAPFADYIAINVSSPNTPGLRSLQDGGFLSELMAELVGRAVAGRTVPIFVKVAPDLTDEALDELLAVCTDAAVSGIIATNTTITRPLLTGPDQQIASETGGLSGRPLTSLAFHRMAYVAGHTDLPVIASGGIMTGADAARALDAGASLVQVYTGFIYRGPALVREIQEECR